MRHLASIQKILSLEPIPNADAIEKATVLGWELVVKKGEFQVGDLCVYCEIDSILPELPLFEFLRSKKFRIKTIKLRDQISQGIAFPLNIISQVSPKTKIHKLKEDQDVTDILKIKKWDPEEEDDLPQERSWISKKFGWLLWKLGLKGKKFGKKLNQTFPVHLCPKSDETRVQNMMSGLIRNQNKLAFVTEKCEGSSITFVYNKKVRSKWGKAEEKFYVCSRNRIITDTKDNFFLVSQKYGIENKLKELGKNIAVQAELIGPGVQGNIYKLNDHEIRVFNVYDTDRKRYLPYKEFIELVNKLDLPMAPLVDENHTVHTDIKNYVEMSKGKSKINPKVIREGIVIRLMEEDFSFKSINPEYLLAQAKIEEKNEKILT